MYLDFPTDTLRSEVPRQQQLEEHFRPKARPVLLPTDEEIGAAVELLWAARRPLVIGGRGARSAGSELRALLDALGAPYLDTSESKGLIPQDHPSVVAAIRGSIMGEADRAIQASRKRHSSSMPIAASVCARLAKVEIQP